VCGGSGGPAAGGGVAGRGSGHLDSYTKEVGGGDTSESERDDGGPHGGRTAGSLLRATLF
jgi:hypothetical protein